MVSVLGTIMIVIAAMIGVVLLPFILWKFFKGVAWFITHIFTFIGGMIGDSLRLVGGVITSIVFLPLVIMNIAIGRWSASRHFWRSFQDEFVGCGHCIYRIAIGHPARLLMLTPLTEGLERRIPEALAQAPTSDKPSRRVGTFEGYEIIGSLKGGGSGGKLYIARPSKQKLAAFSRRGREGVEKVVIKSFSVSDGSTLPQIVRESRALEAARDLGLVLDHELNGERFFYVMPYMPGDSLSVVTERLHTKSGAEGLNNQQLRNGLGYITDLLATLSMYHDAGLWHKDIKPDNIIVGPDGRAHLVDLGLVTPLRSAMTLTTHGTEYFRDPELVRLALRGVKVHEVPGAKFDVYGAGACLYATIERSFPAHGGLSQITRRCPEALRWIVRRSMADIEQRYASAREMLMDVEFVRQASDPHALKPADLPSMSGGYVDDLPPAPEPVSFTPPAGTPRPPHAPAYEAPRAAPRAPAGKKRFRVTDWWTGKYVAEGDMPDAPGQRAARVVPVDRRRPAADQRRVARERVAAARARAQQRMSGKHGAVHARPQKSSNKAFWPILMVGFCLFLALGLAMLMPATRVGGASAYPAVVGHGAPILISDIEKSRTVRMTNDIAATYMSETVNDFFVLLDPTDVMREGDNDAKNFVNAMLAKGVKLDIEPNEDVEASMLSIIGASLPGDPDTTVDLLDWLKNSSMSDGYNGVIWIGAPTAGSADVPAWQIVYLHRAPEPEQMEINTPPDVPGDALGKGAHDGDSVDNGWWDEIGEWHHELLDVVQGDIKDALGDVRDDVGDGACDVIDGARGAVSYSESCDSGR